MSFTDYHNYSLHLGNVGAVGQPLLRCLRSFAPPEASISTLLPTQISNEPIKNHPATIEIRLVDQYQSSPCLASLVKQSNLLRSKRSKSDRPLI